MTQLRSWRALDLADQQEIRRKWEAGARGVDLEREYGLPARVISNQVYWGKWQRTELPLPVTAPAIEVETATTAEWAKAVEVEKLQSQVRQLRRQYDQAVKSAAAIDRLVETAKDAIVAANPVKPLVVPKPSFKEAGEHRAIALLSDVHVGEVVSAEETNNLAQYDLGLFRSRLQLWVEKIVELVNLRRHRLWVPELEIFMLGDIVSGDIHDELVATNEGSVLDQVVEAATSISNALLTLSRHFESVRVTGVVGNHGRTSRKPYFKRKQILSWDYLAYQMMAMALRNQPNLEFYIPKSFWTIREVLGTKFLLMHGDGIQSWAGFPWYGVGRTVSRLRELIGPTEYFDKVVMGHFHEPIETEEFIVSGSWKGGDEFSIGKMYKTTRPSQTLLYAHPHYGVVGTEKIYLDGGEKAQVQLSEGRWEW